ncbi:HIT family hydrolase, partial [Isoptericola sp. NPDC055063]
MTGESPTTVPAGEFGPPEDGMQRLWTPHRMVYIGGQDKPADGSVAQCPFCRIPAGGEKERPVVAPREECSAVFHPSPSHPRPPPV